MIQYRIIKHAPFIVMVCCLGMAGCSHTPPKHEETPSSAAIDENELGSSDQGKAMGLQSVHFGFDSSLLDQEGKSILTKDSEILKTHPSVKIQIEGHCDVRGGIQYNIALGEKRANSTKDFLVDLGVPEARIATISYGKERPLDSGDTEEAYAKNRRANFVLTAK